MQQEAWPVDEEGARAREEAPCSVITVTSYALTSTSCSECPSFLAAEPPASLKETLAANRM